MAMTFLEFTEGANEAWLTGIKYEPETNDSRAAVKLRFSEKPTSESFTAPFTNVPISVPRANDEPGTKIMFEKRFKSVLYPLVGLKDEDKIKLSELFVAIREQLKTSDIKCQLLVSQREGTQIDNRTGKNRVFSEVEELIPMELLDKAEYVSNIEYEDLSDL